MFGLFEIFVPLFQWHACKLAKLSACIAKCMTTIDEINEIKLMEVVTNLWQLFCNISSNKHSLEVNPQVLHC